MILSTQATRKKSLGQELNARQRACLKVIAEIDRQNEQQFMQKWHTTEPERRPLAESWRWLYFDYDPISGSTETKLKEQLRQVGISGSGAKATMKALWLRGVIDIRNERLGRYRVLSVQMTDVGRKVARR
jgi:hypothetical protein